MAIENESTLSQIKNNDGNKIKDKKIYIEEILNGAIPVLSNNLVPVTIDNDGIVRKTDIYEKCIVIKKNMG